MSELGIPFLKNSDQKYLKKNRKSMSKLPHVNKKPLAFQHRFITLLQN